MQSYLPGMDTRINVSFLHTGTLFIFISLFCQRYFKYSNIWGRFVFFLILFPITNVTKSVLSLNRSVQLCFGFIDRVMLLISRVRAGFFHSLIIDVFSPSNRCAPQAPDGPGNSFPV